MKYRHPLLRSLGQDTKLLIKEANDELISKYIYGNRRFWSRGYFVCSIGKGASYETIKQYIENQG